MAASRALSSVFLYPHGMFGRLGLDSPGRLLSRLHTYALTAVGTSTSTSTSFQRAPPSTTSSHSSFVVHTDTLASDGGTDTAPQPVELLLAALVGCEQATAHFVSRHMRVDKKRVKIDTIKFDYHAVRDERGAASLPEGPEGALEGGLEWLVAGGPRSRRCWFQWWCAVAGTSGSHAILF